LALPPWLAGAVALAGGATARRAPPGFVLVGLALLALALGMLRAGAYQAVQPRAAAADGVAISATATVIHAPGRLDRAPLLLQLESVDPGVDEAGSPLPAVATAGDRVHAFTYSPAYFEGAYLGLEGTLRLYPDHASRRTIGRVENAWLRGLERERPTVGGGLTALRQRLDAAIHDALPEPHAGLLSAILLGVRSDIPTAVMQDLRGSGLIHLIVSGYNVTLLAIVIRRAAGLLLGRRGVWVAIALLPLYAILVGGDPPVVRATVMAELVLLAWLLGRESDLLVSLAVTGAAMVLLAPRIADQLSALPRVLAELIAITVSAQLLVTPLLILHFGRVSLVAVPANVLVVGFSPWVMLTGIVVMVWSLLALPGLGAVTWSAWAPIEYLLRIAAGANDSALAGVQVPGTPSWSVAAVYLLAAGWLWWLGRPADPTTAPLTMPPQWRGDLVLLGDRPPAILTTAGFHDATGADVLVAGLGGPGRAVIVPGDAPVRRAPDGAAVRLEQTGGTYWVTFVRS
jgi:predicted membrane metal-binding protein